MTFDLPSITTLLTLISSFQIGAFILNCLKLVLEYRNKAQFNIIEAMTKDLNEALKSIEELKVENKEFKIDNQKLHDQMNVLKQDNATLMGLLSSQENRDIAIREYLKKK